MSRLKTSYQLLESCGLGGVQFPEDCGVVNYPATESVTVLSDGPPVVVLTGEQYRERVMDGIFRVAKRFAGGRDLAVCRLEERAPHGADWVPLPSEVLIALMKDSFFPGEA